MSILDDHKHEPVYSEAGDVTGVVAHGDLSGSEIRDLLEAHTGNRAEYNEPFCGWHRWVPIPPERRHNLNKMLYDAEEGKPGAFFATTLDVR